MIKSKRFWVPIVLSILFTLPYFLHVVNAANDYPARDKGEEIPETRFHPHDFASGYRLELPVGWNIHDGQNADIFISSLDKKTFIISLLDQSTEFSGQNPLAWFKDFLKPGNFPADQTLLAYEDPVPFPLEGYQIARYTFLQDKSKGDSVFILPPGMEKIYILMYMSAPGKVDEYLSSYRNVFEHVVKSFYISDIKKPSGSITLSEDSQEKIFLSPFTLNMLRNDLLSADYFDNGHRDSAFIVKQHKKIRDVIEETIAQAISDFRETRIRYERLQPAFARLLASWGEPPSSPPENRVFLGHKQIVTDYFNLQQILFLIDENIEKQLQDNARINEFLPVVFALTDITESVKTKSIVPLLAWSAAGEMQDTLPDNVRNVLFDIQTEEHSNFERLVQLNTLQNNSFVTIQAGLDTLRQFEGEVGLLAIDRIRNDIAGIREIKIPSGRDNDFIQTAGEVLGLYEFTADELEKDLRNRASSQNLSHLLKSIGKIIGPKPAYAGFSETLREYSRNIRSFAETTRQQAAIIGAEAYKKTAYAVKKTTGAIRATGGLALNAVDLMTNVVSVELNSNTNSPFCVYTLGEKLTGREELQVQHDNEVATQKREHLIEKADEGYREFLYDKAGARAADNILRNEAVFKNLKENFKNVSGDYLLQPLEAYTSEKVGKDSLLTKTVSVVRTSHGFIADALSGLVTDFGEGMVEFCDPNASDEQITGGALKVLFSALDGTVPVKAYLAGQSGLKATAKSTVEHIFQRAGRYISETYPNAINYAKSRLDKIQKILAKTPNLGANLKSRNIIVKPQSTPSTFSTAFWEEAEKITAKHSLDAPGFWMTMKNELASKLSTQTIVDYFADPFLDGLIMDWIERPVIEQHKQGRVLEVYVKQQHVEGQSDAPDIFLDATVRLYRPDGTYDRTEATSNGRALFSELEEGSYHIDVTSGEYAPDHIRNLAIEEGQELGYRRTFRLLKLATVSARVAEKIVKDSQEIENRVHNATITIKGEHSGIERTLETGVGEVSFENLPADVYNLAAFAPGYQTGERQVTVDLTKKITYHGPIWVSKSQEVRLVLTVKNKATNSTAANAVVYLKPASAEDYQKKAAPDGTAVFANLPKGTYEYAATSKTHRSGIHTISINPSAQLKYRKTIWLDEEIPDLKWLHDLIESTKNVNKAMEAIGMGSMGGANQK